MQSAYNFRRRARAPFRRIHSFRIAIAFAACITSAPAQTGSPSSPLASVQVEGSSRFKSEQIAPFTGLSAGTVVTREDIQAGADRLAKLGPFSSVQYRYSTAGAAIKLEYQVADAPEVAAGRRADQRN
jgi:outer membrane protein assembly factor BamA